MPRARQLKPGFFKNEVLAKCSPWARLLFEGLWCLADREGRLEDRPDRLKGEIFPYDRVKTDQLLGELESKVEADGSPAFLVRYEVRGRRYIQIVNFSKHQNPHHRELPSTIPAPGKPGTGPRPARGKPGASTGPAPGQPRASRASSLTPSSLTPSSNEPLPPTASQSTPPPPGEGSAMTSDDPVALNPGDLEFVDARPIDAGAVKNVLVASFVTSLERQADTNLYPWDSEDEAKYGHHARPHPRWQDYVELHMRARRPPPWPRFMEWLESDGGREVSDARS